MTNLNIIYYCCILNHNSRFTKKILSKASTTPCAIFYTGSRLIVENIKKELMTLAL